MSSNHFGGFWDKSDGIGNFIIRFLRNTKLRSALESSATNLRTVGTVNSIDRLNSYWRRKGIRGIKKLDVLNVLLSILWESGTHEVSNAEYEVLTSKKWDWQYLIDFDSNKFIVRYGYTGCVSDWILKEIPERYEIFGSLQSGYDSETTF